MGVGEYLERVDNNEYVRFRTLLENEPEEALEVFDNSRVEAGRVVVDEDYALERMFDEKTNYEEILEAPVRNFLSGSYEKGRAQGENKAEELERKHNQTNAMDMITDKVKSNDHKAKIADLGVLVGLGGVTGSASFGSLSGMAVSTVVGVASGKKSAQYQGIRDSERNAAVEGLDDAYGHLWLDID